MLPPDLRDRFAGSFVADTSTMTPARAVSTLDDGGRVQAVSDPPGGIAACLRFPLGRGDRT